MQDDRIEPEPALRWLSDAVAAGEGGKVLLAGFTDAGSCGAWAAGLAGTADYPNFVTFARYLLQKVHACSGYWLMLPGERVGTYQLELRSRNRCWTGACCYLDGAWQLDHAPAAQLPDNLMDNLLEPGSQLPGLMRRELDSLAERLVISAPA